MTRVRRLLLRGRRWWFRFRCPWPLVGECNSSHFAEHACEQCEPTHAHRWKAWPKAPEWWKSGPGVPVRCRSCGARKCDSEDCRERRHDHTHIEGMAFPVIYARDDR
jgi:hypothetical protein